MLKGVLTKELKTYVCIKTCIVFVSSDLIYLPSSVCESSFVMSATSFDDKSRYGLCCAMRWQPTLRLVSGLTLLFK